jgi:putative hemolysin
MPSDIKYIDVKKVIGQSDSNLLKRLPSVVVKLLTKLVQQDPINHIINKYSNDIGINFLPKVIEEFNLNLEIVGIENLPENGKCFFVANHPFGIIDGLVLTRIVSRKYGSVKGIANEGFMMVPQLRPLVAAVNVFDHSPREYIEALEEVYNDNVPISHFPSGEVSRRYKGKIQDTIWQKSFITKAVSSKRDVVPLFFYGRNSNLFYMVYMTRRFLGIKTNIELILLPLEMLRKRNKTIKVKIGKPISYEMFDKSNTPLEWAQKIRAQVYNLGKT